MGNKSMEFRESDYLEEIANVEKQVRSLRTAVQLMDPFEVSMACAELSEALEVLADMASEDEDIDDDEWEREEAEQAQMEEEGYYDD